MSQCRNSSYQVSLLIWILWNIANLQFPIHLKNQFDWWGVYEITGRQKRILQVKRNSWYIDLNQILNFLCVLSRPLRTQQVQQKIRMYNWQYMQLHIDVLVQKRRNSSVLAMELDLPFTNPSIYL